MTPHDLQYERLHGEVVVVSFVAPPSCLTQAERAIALEILAGRTNAQIARLRGVSIRTVANQIASLLEKVDVWSRVELAGRYTAADLLQT